MKTRTITQTLYSYNELSEQAKQAVKDWYLQDEARNDFFYEDITEFLKMEYPESNFDVQYDFTGNQGDGLNIFGTLEKGDAHKIASEQGNFTEKELLTLSFYLNYASIDFSENNRYTYSCKFIDRQTAAEDFISILRDANFLRGINCDLIKKFIDVIFNYFEKLENTLEQGGYKYFYEVDEEEITDFCNSNDYMFFENGEIA